MVIAEKRQHRRLTLEVLIFPWYEKNNWETHKENPLGLSKNILSESQTHIKRLNMCRLWWLKAGLCKTFKKLPAHVNVRSTTSSKLHTPAVLQSSKVCLAQLGFMASLSTFVFASFVFSRFLHSILLLSPVLCLTANSCMFSCISL